MEALEKQVVIRKSPLGHLLFYGGIAAFVVIGIFLIQEERAVWIGIASIVFFGGGGLFYLIFKSWKPIAIISDKGITVPLWRGKNFVPWENVRKFEVLEQTVNTGRGGSHTLKCIGIFVFDTTGIAGAGEISQTLNQSVTGWKEMPASLIKTQFTFIKEESIIRVLQEFHDAYIAERIK